MWCAYMLGLSFLFETDSISIFCFATATQFSTLIFMCNLLRHGLNLVHSWNEKRHKKLKQVHKVKRCTSDPFRMPAVGKVFK